MKQCKSVILEIALVFSMVTGTLSYATAENLAGGNLTVDGETTTIEYAYADIFDGDITVVLTSKTIPEDMVPDGVYNLGKKGKFRGIVFVVSKEKQALLTGGLEKLINAIHFAPLWNNLGSVGNGNLTIEQLDDDTLSGKISTPSDNELAGHIFSYEISFSVSIKKEPLQLEISGKANPPAKAFAAWGKALLAGDSDEYKRHTSREILEFLPEDPKELALGMELQQSMFPTKIEILSSTIDGQKAILVMIGLRSGNVSDGNATMLLEDGEWKVNKQTWSSNETKE